MPRLYPPLLSIRTMRGGRAATAWGLRVANATALGALRRAVLASAMLWECNNNGRRFIREANKGEAGQVEVLPSPPLEGVTPKQHKPTKTHLTKVDAYVSRETEPSRFQPELASLARTWTKTLTPLEN